MPEKQANSQKDEFISEKQIEQWKQEAFEKYGVTQVADDDICATKVRIFTDERMQTRNALREAFPELTFEEIKLINIEQLLSIVTTDLDN